ncbi:hypothetical protein AB5J72_09215 [Streptomyces sp. CG1]|uniref:hypothetical protein n=1 Tax=Streptomyces sp. CG1 TaxID=1287523 RepID=UPI0034E2431C
MRTSETVRVISFGDGHDPPDTVAGERLARGAGDVDVRRFGTRCVPVVRREPEDRLGSVDHALAERGPRGSIAVVVPSHMSAVILAWRPRNSVDTGHCWFRDHLAATASWRRKRRLTPWWMLRTPVVQNIRG